MKKSISRLARKFINKDLKKQLNFEDVEKYLNKIGYVVLFYDEYENIEIIQNYELVEYSQSCDAFTINAENTKLVFIRKSLSSQDMLYTLLHETGHIILKHLDVNSTTANKHIQEIEADAFVHEVLNYTGNKHIFHILIACMMIFCVFLGMQFYNALDEIKIIPEVTHEAVTVVSTYTPEKQTYFVYVTPSGTKYHRLDCRYAKNKKCTKLTVSEAMQKYTPCSVCKP